MSLGNYLRMVIGEFILLFVATTALSYVVTSAFYASVPYAGNISVALVVCGVLLAALYAISYNRRSLIIGGIVLAAVLVALLMIGIVSAGGANAFDDSTDNLFLYIVICVVVTLLSFVCTRIRFTTIIFMVLGCLVCALIEFMFEEYHFIAVAVYVFACIAYLVYQNYRRGLKGTVSKRTSFVMSTVASVIAAVLAGLLCFGVVFGILVPLDLPAQDVKLFTEYRAFEELPRRGTNAELSITDPDLQSILINDETQEAEQDQEQDQQLESDERNGNGSGFAETLQNLGSSIGYNFESTVEMFSLITFNMPWWGWIYVIIAVALIIAIPIVVKLLLRRRFYRRTLEKTSRGYVKTLYERILRDLGRCGIKRSDWATPYEFADAVEHETSHFSVNETNTNFSLLTLIFVKADYGIEPLSVDDVVAYHGFYRSFFKNCRAYVGLRRYIFLFFRL